MSALLASLSACATGQKVPTCALGDTALECVKDADDKIGYEIPFPKAKGYVCLSPDDAATVVQGCFLRGAVSSVPKK